MGAAKSKLSSERITELSQKTRFTTKDLLQWHRGFIKDCPSGRLLKTDFKEIYKRYFPFGDSSYYLLKCSQYAHFIFTLLDIDKDGYLSFEEFIIALDLSAKGTIEEKLACN
jgi:Ca2+-binding EF-hand superfamily protein